MFQVFHINWLQRCRVYGENLGDVASNRRLSVETSFKIYTLWTSIVTKGVFCYHLVPIALGKHLFSFRTQKLRPVAPIILLCGKLGRCQIMKKPLERVAFSCVGGGSARLPIPRHLRARRGENPRRSFSSFS